jgi:hypothetical protein
MKYIYIVISIIVIISLIIYYCSCSHNSNRRRAQDYKSNYAYSNTLNKPRNSDLDSGSGLRHSKLSDSTDNQTYPRSPDLDLDSAHTNLSNNSNKSINNYYSNMQFHTDYRDTLAAFNDIAPSQKPVFNEGNYAELHTRPKTNNREIRDIITNFIKVLNKDIKTNVSAYLTANSGWDEPLMQKQPESGWDKFRKALELPSSLFGNPASKSPVKLIQIDQVDKYKTDFEIKYVINIIIQKLNVEDQMIVKISFVRDLRDKKNPHNMIIEEIFIVGFLTNEQQNMETDDNNLAGPNRKAFYDFKGLETSNMTDIIDNKTIVKELNKKYDHLNQANKNFISHLDQESRKFQEELPPMSDLDAFKCTRTVYDDLGGKPIIYN